MAVRNTRISRSIRGFNEDIYITNDYLKKMSPDSLTITNGVRLGWTVAELEQWELFYTLWAALMVKYGNKRVSRTTDIKDQMMQIIKQCVAYEKEHHLYDRIAIHPNAINTDFETFRIIRGTPLASTSNTRVAEPGTREEVIVVKEIGSLFHQLLVTTADKLGRGKDEGVKDVMVYKAVTLANGTAPLVSEYKYVGDTSRGLITVIQDELDLGKKAWYIARIKNTRGEIGVPSAAVSAIIV